MIIMIIMIMIMIILTMTIIMTTIMIIIIMIIKVIIIIKTTTIPNRVGQSREIYSNSVPLSPPHWPYPKRIRPPSWPRVAVASSIQNTKLFTWRTWPGAAAVPKCDWAARSQCGFKQRRADHTKYIWYVATHDQSVITTELMIAWIWWRGWLCIISSVIVWKMTI